MSSMSLFISIYSPSLIPPCPPCPSLSPSTVCPSSLHVRHVSLYLHLQSVPHPSMSSMCLFISIFSPSLIPPCPSCPSLSPSTVRPSSLHVLHVPLYLHLQSVPHPSMSAMFLFISIYSPSLIPPCRPCPSLSPSTVRPSSLQILHVPLHLHLQSVPHPSMSAMFLFISISFPFPRSDSYPQETRSQHCWFLSPSSHIM